MSSFAILVLLAVHTTLTLPSPLPESDNDRGVRNVADAEDRAVDAGRATGRNGKGHRAVQDRPRKGKVLFHTGKSSSNVNVASDAIASKARRDAVRTRRDGNRARRDGGGDGKRRARRDAGGAVRDTIKSRRVGNTSRRVRGGARCEADGDRRASAKTRRDGSRAGRNAGVSKARRYIAGAHRDVVRASRDSGGARRESGGDRREGGGTRRNAAFVHRKATKVRGDSSEGEFVSHTGNSADNISAALDVVRIDARRDALDGKKARRHSRGASNTAKPKGAAKSSTKTTTEAITEDMQLTHLTKGKGVQQTTALAFEMARDMANLLMGMPKKEAYKIGKKSAKAAKKELIKMFFSTPVWFSSSWWYVTTWYRSIWATSFWEWDWAWEWFQVWNSMGDSWKWATYGRWWNWNSEWQWWNWHNVANNRAWHYMKKRWKWWKWRWSGGSGYHWWNRGTYDSYGISYWRDLGLTYTGYMYQPGSVLNVKSWNTEKFGHQYYMNRRRYSQSAESKDEDNDLTVQLRNRSKVTGFVKLLYERADNLEAKLAKLFAIDRQATRLLQRATVLNDRYEAYQAEHGDELSESPWWANLPTLINSHVLKALTLIEKIKADSHNFVNADMYGGVLDTKWTQWIEKYLMERQEAFRDVPSWSEYPTVPSSSHPAEPRTSPIVLANILQGAGGGSGTSMFEESSDEAPLPASLLEVGEEEGALEGASDDPTQETSMFASGLDHKLKEADERLIRQINKLQFDMRERAIKAEDEHKMAREGQQMLMERLSTAEATRKHLAKLLVQRGYADNMKRLQLVEENIARIDRKRRALRGRATYLKDKAEKLATKMLVQKKIMGFRMHKRARQFRSKRLRNIIRLVRLMRRRVLLTNAQDEELAWRAARWREKEARIRAFVHVHNAMDQDEKMIPYRETDGPKRHGGVSDDDSVLAPAKLHGAMFDGLGYTPVTDLAEKGRLPLFKKSFEGFVPPQEVKAAAEETLPRLVDADMPYARDITERQRIDFDDLELDGGYPLAKTIMDSQNLHVTTHRASGHIPHPLPR